MWQKNEVGPSERFLDYRAGNGLPLLNDILTESLAQKNLVIGAISAEH